MQRFPRLELVCLWQAPGVLRHVMGRGIERSGKENTPEGLSTFGTRVPYESYSFFDDYI